MIIKIYQTMVEKHGDVAKNRFPHLSYGQDPNSESFKNSYPGSFKRYFYRIVNKIVRMKNGKKMMTKN